MKFRKQLCFPAIGKHTYEVQINVTLFEEFFFCFTMISKTMRNFGMCMFKTRAAVNRGLLSRPCPSACLPWFARGVVTKHHKLVVPATVVFCLSILEAGSPRSRW